MNSTNCAGPFSFHPQCMVPPNTPFYYTHQPNVLSFISDQHLTVAAPVIAYWGLSLLFHYFDMMQFKWMEKYRIHESAEVASRNLVTRWQVVKAVVFQQVIQTVLGLVWVDGAPPLVDHGAEMQKIGNNLMSFLTSVLDERTAKDILNSFGPQCVYTIYWWAIPGLQFLAAIFFIDTWQYFLHRSMHMNKFLYKHVHSWHHRLYVPYAFGSLYNHPVEGFLLDTLGAAIAEAVTFMSVRQAMFLFTISTLKTVDDHCGYKLPFDPLQLITSNNADYHDIHHQIVGIKHNFAQPFFIHWDDWLGTRMTREDIKKRKAKSS